MDVQLPGKPGLAAGCSFDIRIDPARSVQRVCRARASDIGVICAFLAGPLADFINGAEDRVAGHASITRRAMQGISGDVN